MCNPIKMHIPHPCWKKSNECFTIGGKWRKKYCWPPYHCMQPSLRWKLGYLSSWVCRVTMLHLWKDSSKCPCNQPQHGWQSTSMAFLFQDMRNYEPVWIQAEPKITRWGLTQHCPPGNHFSLKVFSWFYYWWKSI